MTTVKQYYNAAAAYMGLKEGGAKHKEIIDIYNTINPLPRGVKASVNYAWCAIFVSAIAKKLGLSNKTFPYEMSCAYMHTWAVNNGKWRTTPKVGYLIIYNWKNNNTRYDHVGFIYDETANYINVIEGNKSDSVGTRRISKTNAEIEGYIDIGITNDNTNNNDNNSGNNDNNGGNSGGGNNNGGIEYRVIKGDTLSKIARKYGVTVAEIVNANNIKNANLIFVNQLLIIPTKGETSTHTPQELETIARAVIRGKYGNGATRKAKLESMGYNYSEVQALVNKMLYNK